MASGQEVKVISQVQVQFSLAHKSFSESFIVIPTVNSVILGNGFFIKHDISINPNRNTLQLSDLTIQINEIKPANEPRRSVKPKKISVTINKKHTIPANEQIVMECRLCGVFEKFENFSGVVIPNETLERNLDLAITSSLSTVNANNIIYISALNITDHSITLAKDTEVAKFSFLTSEQAENLQQIDPELIALAQMQSETKDIVEINQLIQDFTKKGQKQPARPAPEYNKLWFPTPETCTDPANLSPLQREIYDQILRFQKIEKQNPIENDIDRNNFLQRFPWEKSKLSAEEKLIVENLLIEFQDIFAKHRFDVGYNTELKNKLIPEHDLPVYVHGPPTPIHLRDELHVELALMHYYNNIVAVKV